MTRSYRSHHLLLATLAGAGLAHAADAVLRGLAAARRRLDRSAVPLQTAERTHVLVVDDPDGTMRLVAVDGSMDLASISALEAAMFDVTPGTPLHVDLTAVSSWPAHSLTALEAVFDRIEMHGARLRVIGIDPRLPALPRPLGS